MLAKQERLSSGVDPETRWGQTRRIRSPVGLMVLLLGVILLLLWISIALGSVPITFSELWQALWGQGDPIRQTIVWQLRLPRALLAQLLGAALGMAGALLQGMLGNGLADPYLLGISAGAGLAAVALLTWGEWTAWVPLAAWVGGVLTTVLVYGLARTRSGLAVERLILAGVAVSALFGAISSALLLLADERVQVALTWLIGSLSGRGWPEVRVAGVYILAGLGLGWAQARALNLLGLGEEMAVSLGIPLVRTRVTIGLVAALLAAAVVSVGGLIGFVGLVVPHMVRQGVGSDHRWLLPLSALAGAALLSGADLLARLGAVELPVGIVTALMGAPFFGWLLRQREAGQ
ncbi:FecCD family ABC transporter permease [Synechococcus sp. OH20]|uniref:FecCD family ABC transporter permease n=1 Tax=Synechococcus sp. OH20 TaxID=139337 RepID=UPI0039C6364C